MGYTISIFCMGRNSLSKLIMSLKDLEGQMARWLEILDMNDNEVVSCPGPKHGNADALLRQPCSCGKCGFCDRIEAKHKSSHNFGCWTQKFHC